MVVVHLSSDLVKLFSCEDVAACLNVRLVVRFSIRMWWASFTFIGERRTGFLLSIDEDDETVVKPKEAPLKEAFCETDHGPVFRRAGLPICQRNRVMGRDWENCSKKDHKTDSCHGLPWFHFYSTSASTENWNSVYGATDNRGKSFYDVWSSRPRFSQSYVTTPDYYRGSSREAAPAPVIGADWHLLLTANSRLGLVPILMKRKERVDVVTIKGKWVVTTFMDKVKDSVLVERSKSLVFEHSPMVRESWVQS